MGPSRFPEPGRCPCSTPESGQSMGAMDVLQESHGGVRRASGPYSGARQLSLLCNWLVRAPKQFTGR